MQHEQDLPDVMTMQEVADFLRISRPTLWRLIRDSELVAFHVKSSNRVLRKDLMKYIETSGLDA